MKTLKIYEGKEIIKEVNKVDNEEMNEIINMCNADKEVTNSVAARRVELNGTNYYIFREYENGGYYYYLFTNMKKIPVIQYYKSLSNTIENTLNDCHKSNYIGKIFNNGKIKYLITVNYVKPNKELLNKRIKQISLPREVWKQFPDSKSYFISNYGRILNKNGYIIKGHKQNNGYLGFCFTNNEGEQVHTTVHRVVAYTFGLIDVLKYDGINDIDHINQDREDCHLSNLQVLSHPKNIEKRDINGAPRLGCCGKLNPLSKPIYCYNGKTGELIGYYESANLAAKDLGISQPSIVVCLKGKQKTTCYGKYAFKYALKNF